MKCEFCGANIDIESDVCPYCGMQKSQFAEHRKAMGRYSRSFQRTRDTVVEKNRTSSRKAGSIAVICVLIAANVLLFCCRMGMYDIYSAVKGASLIREADVHTARLDELEQAGRYEEFAEYYSENDLYYVADEAPYAEYRLVNSFASDYQYTLSQLTRLTMPDDTDTSSSKDKTEYFVTSYDTLVREYNNYITQKADQTFYDESCYSKTHLASIETMMQNINQFIITYLGIDEAQMERFESESNAHRIVMLEEGGKIDE